MKTYMRHRKTKTGCTRYGRRFAGALLVFVMLACNTHMASATESTRQKLEAAKQRRNETQSQLSDMQKGIGNLEDEKEVLEDELDSLNGQLLDIGANIANLNEMIDAKQQVIDETQESLDLAVATRQAQYDAMKLRIQFIFEKQQYVLTDMILQSGSIADLINSGTYIEAMSAYDRQMLDEYQANEDKIALQKAQLDSEMATLAEYQEQARAEQDRFYGMVVATAENINTYTNEITLAEAEADIVRGELAKQQQEVNDLEKKLREELAKSDEARRGTWRSLDGMVFTEDDVYLLANLIYCEAGNQPYEGQVAVGAVVINRVRSSAFRQNTIFDVIYAPSQFSPASNGALALALANNSATDACYNAARDAMSGASPVGNCVFFRTPVPGLEGIVIGGHVFY